MGLEAASFITQLVATNPVGATDPKSQGDDHLRLLKAVLLATFPALNGAVNSTPAELNALHGTQWLNANDGTAAAPAFSWSADTNTGWFRNGADDMRASTGGLQRLRISNNAVELINGVQFAALDGTAGAPGIAWANDLDTGWFRQGADDMRATTGGAQRLRISSTGIELINGVQLLLLDGSLAAPGIAFANDLDTGFWRVGANAIDVALGDLQSSAQFRQSGFSVPDGTAPSPGLNFINDPNTGVYRVGADNISIVAGGQQLIGGTATGSTWGGGHTSLSAGNTAGATAWSLGITSAAGATAGGGAALPATVAGFWAVALNGVARKIPYYAN